VGKDRRRRAFLPIGIAILAVLGGGQYYLSTIFAPPDTGGGNGTAPGADIRPTGFQTPELAVRAVYKSVAINAPDRACGYALKGSAVTAFAKDLGAPGDCTRAVARKSKEVTDQTIYKDQSVSVAAVHPRDTNSATAATIYSCAMAVEGGPSLGTFKLKNDGTGWFITGHEPDPASCPPAASN
jgi:hypothetical protein